mgnify:CR=1 FL=1
MGPPHGTIISSFAAANKWSGVLHETDFIIGEGRKLERYLQICGPTSSMDEMFPDPADDHAMTRDELAVLLSNLL